MSEEEKNKEQNTEETQGASAETEKADTGQEQTIPYSRFTEVNERAKELEQQLEQLEADKKKETVKRLEEQEKWKELADSRGEELADLRAKADKLDAYEKTLEDVLKSQVERVPENMRKLIPEQLSVQARLDWLAQNQDLLLKPKSFDIGAGRQGGQSDDEVDLTPEQRAAAKKMGISPEDYADNL